MVNGKFPPNQAAFNNFADSYLDADLGVARAAPRAAATCTAGCSPGFWNDGAHGVTTISKTDPDLHYIHVVTPPSGSTLSVRDNGYRVSRGDQPAHRRAGAFSQSSGHADADRHLRLGPVRHGLQGRSPAAARASTRRVVH